MSLPRSIAPKRMVRCETSHAAKQGLCAVWLNADTLCDRPLNHDGDHVGHDPSGSGQWIRVNHQGYRVAYGPSEEEEAPEWPGTPVTKLRRAMLGCDEYQDAPQLRRYLRENADAVCGLVGAALDVSWREMAHNPDAVVRYGTEQTWHDMRRLVGAARRFLSLDPPQPITEPTIRCPAEGCLWRRRADDDQAEVEYRKHYGTEHS